MTVIPELEPMLQMSQAMPPLDFDNIPEMRRQGNEVPDGLLGIYVPETEGVTTTSIQIPVDGAEIEMRISSPDGAATGRPVLFYMHGGGWVLMSARSSDRFCRRMASLTDSVVASVDYRLAPEVKFPVPLEDCYTALQWVVDHADELGADASNIVVAGQSAGGNLAAALALLCRDRGGPALRGQFLEVPALDLTLPDDDSLLAYGEGFGLNRSDMVKTARCYVNEEDERSPYCSPLLAADLSGLPSAIVTTADMDGLRDQGKRYADALAAAGVPVRYTNWEGHLHSTMSLVTLAESTQAYEKEIIAALEEVRALGA